MSRLRQNWEALNKLEDSLYGTFNDAKERGVELPVAITDYLAFLESLRERRTVPNQCLDGP